MSRRMKVTRSGTHYVLDDGSAYPSMAAAFRAVLDRGGRVHLDWDRTVIKGEARPRDFCATFDGQDAGRIYIIESGMSKGLWKAFPSGHNRETNRMGTGVQLVDTKDEAVAFIERRFTELMAGSDPHSIPNAYAKAKGMA